MKMDITIEDLPDDLKKYSDILGTHPIIKDDVDGQFRFRTNRLICVLNSKHKFDKDMIADLLSHDVIRREEVMQYYREFFGMFRAFIRGREMRKIYEFIDNGWEMFA